MSNGNYVEVMVEDPRYWAKVDRSAGPDACWPWTAAFGSTGYGAYRSPEGKTVKAHRYAAGAPAGAVVRHSCDNPPCCNPAHLFIGTQADNVADMVAKGRYRGCPPEKQPRGDQHHNANLTADQVVAIRERYAAGETQRALAEAYGVWVTTIGAIVKGRQWAHVGGPITVKAAGRPRKKVTT